MCRMKHKNRWLAVLFAVLTTVTIAGCVTEMALAGLGTFGLGFAWGRATTPTVTETLCYLNGELVDCASLPE